MVSAYYNTILQISTNIYHGYWCSWLGKGPAHARTRLCGKGWHRDQDANSRGTFPASRHRLTPMELLWTRWLGPGRGAKPESNNSLCSIRDCHKVGQNLNLSFGLHSFVMTVLTYLMPKLWRFRQICVAFSENLNFTNLNVVKRVKTTMHTFL